MQKNALTRLTSLYLCLMLTVFLLWPGTSGYAQIAEAKYRLFLWLTGGYCALSVLLWFARPSLAEWLLLGYLLCSLIACLLSPWREETWLGGARHEGLLTIALYVLSFSFPRQQPDCDCADDHLYQYQQGSGLLAEHEQRVRGISSVFTRRAGNGAGRYEVLRGHNPARCACSAGEQ